MNYKTKYKHLVVSGCSYTANDYHESISWGNMLADIAGMQIHNLAVPSESNEHISRSVMHYLSANNMSPLDTLVLVMWSGLDRASLIVESDKYTIEKQHPEYRYNEHSEYFLLGGDNFGPDTDFCNTYRSLVGENTQVLLNWINMQNLYNYLELNQYTYRFTTLSQILDTDIITNKFKFNKHLKRLNLKLDYSKWILINRMQTLDEVAHMHNLCYPKSAAGYLAGHPTAEGHYKWTTEYLVQVLLNQGILYEL